MGPSPPSSSTTAARRCPATGATRARAPSAARRRGPGALTRVQRAVGAVTAAHLSVPEHGVARCAVVGASALAPRVGYGTGRYGVSRVASDAAAPIASRAIEASGPAAVVDADAHAVARHPRLADADARRGIRKECTAHHAAGPHVAAGSAAILAEVGGCPYAARTVALPRTAARSARLPVVPRRGDAARAVALDGASARAAARTVVAGRGHAASPIAFRLPSAGSAARAVISRRRHAACTGAIDGAAARAAAVPVCGWRHTARAIALNRTAARAARRAKVRRSRLAA